MKDINWFKKEIQPLLTEYEVVYKFFENGDFGSLNQVEFNTEKKGGGIDFWSTGWLEVGLVNYITGEVLLNAFLEPDQQEEQEKVLKRLKELL